MALPTGSGSEILKRGTIHAMSSTDWTAFKFTGDNESTAHANKKTKKSNTPRSINRRKSDSQDIYSVYQKRQQQGAVTQYYETNQNNNIC